MRNSLRTFGVAAHVASQPSAKSRNGFVIVEIIVAMILLAIAIASLASLVYSISQSGMVATGNAYRNGVLMSAVNTYEGIPYDSVANATRKDSVTTAPYPYVRTVTVTEPVVGVIKNITVIIQPKNPKYKPDTVTFIRTKARTSHVLCQTCQ